MLKEPNIVLVLRIYANVKGTQHRFSLEFTQIYINYTASRKSITYIKCIVTF